MRQPKDTGICHLLQVALPLMLSQLSMTGMMFIDRLFVAHYSPQAFSAAVSAGTLAWAFIFGLSQLTGISSVYVAQYNGAKEYSRIGTVVWQMLWFSLFMTPPVLVIAYFGSPLFFYHSSIAVEQTLYFRWMLYTSPLFSALAALIGFYIGRKKTSIITVVSLLGNGLNAVMDPILIYGWGPFPRLGIRGACIATGLGIALQVAILFILFLRPSIKVKFSTDRFQIDFSEMVRCIKIGLPDGLGVALELFMWGLFYLAMSGLSIVHIMVASIGQTLILLFIWYPLGLHLALSSLAGNLIGAGRVSELSRLVKSGACTALFFAIAFFVTMLLFGEAIVQIFLDTPAVLEEGIDRISDIDREMIFTTAIFGLIFVWLYLSMDTLRMMFHGLLRGAGDTFFLMIATISTIFTMQVVPTYLFLVYLEMPVWTLFFIWIFCITAEFSVVLIRYRSRAWLKRIAL